MSRDCRSIRLLVAVLTTCGAAHAMGQENDSKPIQTWALASEKVQQDYPDLCLDRAGTPWIVYIEHDGQVDRLKVATKKAGEELTEVGSVSEPGLIQQPRITCDSKGAVWVVWSQLDENDVWNLYARRIVDEKPDAKIVPIAVAEGNDIFAAAGTDRRGRVWVAWQSLRGTTGDIFVRYHDPVAASWSPEIRVTSTAGGEWEPQLAFGDNDHAVIVFDSSAGDSFDVMMATVGLDGKCEITPVAKSPSYEARASVVAAPDGKGFWIAWERGFERWGGDRRSHRVDFGLNARKQIDVVYVDAATKQITPAANVKPLIGALARGPAKPAKSKRPQPSSISVNLPQLFVDSQGTPYLLCRYARNNGVWHIVMTRYDAQQRRWSKPLPLPNSSFNQDRHSCGVADGSGNLWMCWPADLRTTKRPGVSGVYLARLAASTPLALSETSHEPTPTFVPPRNDPARNTPQRPRSERHSWQFADQEYGLYWGDFHRHTSFSNCRTITDGCILEQFRYAYDAGFLDFLGTSDHTDIAKAYTPYEWWENQKLHDLFQVPGFFNSFYVYEREQRWPWGHRNVIFSERGAPIIYIKRQNYRNSPWAKSLPAGEGPAEISPQELWKLLGASGKRAAVISHTGATGMGTDWDLYEQIDAAVENLVEIYQGARVSYEGIGTPQPTVGLNFGQKFNQGTNAPAQQKTAFGKHSKGVYQNALANGHRLGVFASSDHISTNTSFGGVYARSFTRQGILDGIDARRTIAATDKIFLEFSCNGQLLGSALETDQLPELTVKVQGTAPIRRVTIVRNEADHKVFSPEAETKTFAETYTDPQPLEGENRYYVRVEQADGNMAWASPVWVTFTK